MAQKFYKVRGDTLETAYVNMRRKFGEEAVAISTQQIAEGGVWGFFAKKRVEITVSVPVQPSTATMRSQSAVERKYTEQSKLKRSTDMNSRNLQDFKELIRDAQRRINGQSAAPARRSHASRPAASTPPLPSSAPANVDFSAAATAAATPRPSPPSASPVLKFPERRTDSDGDKENVHRELQEIREMMQVIYAESPGAGLPTEFAPHYRTLVNRGVSRKVAASLIGAVLKDSDLTIIRDPRVFMERLHFEIRKMLKVTGGVALQGGSQRVVALCGATGVGKTTNLAKLAAHFCVHERARVGLITADTYRVAAPEQLRVYANIIGVPMRVANDAEETREALHTFYGYDIVLMDTAGGSQYNLEQINELKHILHAAQPHETILAMSAGTPMDDLRNIVSNFTCVHPTSLMFTKLDETRQYGALFSILAESNLPLSYLSVGQNVPDDIRIATPGTIANLILEGKDSRG